MKRWICGFVAAHTLVLLATAAASAQKQDLWATGMLPDETLYKYPVPDHYEWLRWDVCARGTDKQFGDCLVKVNLLENDWAQFINDAIEAPFGTPRTLFAKKLEQLNEETARMDGLFPRGRLAQ